MEDYVKLSDIESSPVFRQLIGLDELDYMYGYSDFGNVIFWGLPLGTISLWSGSSGVGKSRLAIESAKKITSRRNKVLYCQTESTLSDFARWAKNTHQYHTFYCSGENHLEEIIKIMYKVHPHVVIIDSVNEIEEFVNGSKKEARLLIKGEEGKPGLREVAKNLMCHIILLGQLNQDKTIKGGTSLPHLVDSVFDLEPDTESERRFMISVGVKHRYGKKGPYSLWEHTDSGVRCCSNWSTFDEVWCKSHGLELNTIEKEGQKYWASTKRFPVQKQPKVTTSKSLTADEIESAIIRGNLSVSVWKSIFPSWFK